MSFKEIVNSTAAIPYDVNDDFLHVAQGSITPKTGEKLLETTSTYNIGSSAYRWETGYFSGTISASGIERTIFELVSVELTAPAAKIEITGLNGDTDFNYYIESSFVYDSVAAQRVRMWVNGDSATANYYSVLYGGNITVTSAEFIVGEILLNPFVRNNYTNIRSITGKPRFGTTRGTDITYFERVVSVYGDTSTTITSLVFEPSSGSFGTLTSIRIYKYGVE